MACPKSLTSGRVANICAWFVALTICGFAAGDDDRAQDLFQQHRWFDLRDVAVSDPYGGALIKGALAAAFNHPKDAEIWLKRAIHLAKRSEQANAARDKLAAAYLRQGRTREAVAELRRIQKSPTPSPETQSVLDQFTPLASAGATTVRIPAGGVSPPCEVSIEGVRFSLEVNGKKASWTLDTGSSLSSVNESDAQALGIEILGAKFGVVSRMDIAGIEFRNVPVLIVPDSQPLGRGTLGLPILAAMQTLGWKRDGTCHAGFPSAPNPEPSNMAFDDFNLVVRGTLDRRPLDFILDTGNRIESELWRRSINPEIQIEVGGFTVHLKPAKPSPSESGNEFQQGVLGMDVLSQAGEVTLDFRTMTVRLLN